MDVLRVPPSPALRTWSRDHGFSPELVARWGAFYPDLEGLLAALQKPVAQCIRFNPLRGDPAVTRDRLEEKGFVFSESGVPGTLRVNEQPFSPGATEEYLLGLYAIQDASSALAALAVDPQPGELIADLCAAPGGKTIAMAALAHDKAAIFAYDLDKDRARGLESNLNRCGVTSVAAYAAPAEEAEKLGLSFDKILLDAPCTGEGVIPRDPGRRLGQLGEYAACARQQADLVAIAHRLLKPGGLLVYATCTLAPEENELRVEAAVKEYGFVLEELPASVRDLKPGGKPLMPGLTKVAGRVLPPTMTRTAHVLPHIHGCLGFFLACLRKPGAAP